jgi:predicted SnoaL-like aldol condensation-catalyzing enzyme
MLFGRFLSLMSATFLLMAPHMSTPAQQVPQPPELPSTVFRVTSSDAAMERNKATVIAFYDLMFNRANPAEAMRLYGGSQYLQHNPEVPDGKDAFIAYFNKMARDHPDKSVSFKRVFAEGNFVTLHSVHKFPGWLGGSWAAMDIFRLDASGRIVEHWDALQKVPSSAAHNNGMF